MLHQKLSDAVYSFGSSDGSTVGGEYKENSSNSGNTKVAACSYVSRSYMPIFLFVLTIEMCFSYFKLIIAGYTDFFSDD